jgi:hypothetical protein
VRVFHRGFPLTFQSDWYTLPPNQRPVIEKTVPLLVVVVLPRVKQGSEGADALLMAWRIYRCRCAPVWVKLLAVAQHEVLNSFLPRYAEESGAGPAVL